MGSVSTIEHVDSLRLSNDMFYRTEKLSEFIEFTPEDHARIRACKDLFVPLVAAITDAVYDKLFTYDVTKVSFTEKQEGFNGPMSTLDTISVNDPIIRFRKTMLGRYLKKLVTMEYGTPWVKYFDWVGEIHAYSVKKKYKSSVEYIHLNALMGFVHDAITGIVANADSGMDQETKFATMNSFGKFFWLQNDYLVKYHLPQYTETLVTATATASSKPQSALNAALISCALSVGAMLTGAGLAVVVASTVSKLIK